MGIFLAKSKNVKVETETGPSTVRMFENKDIDAFNPFVLGLGDISNLSDEKDAIAATFDLSGFTDFCSQIDPQLAVPEFLSRFLDWLFNQIKTGSVYKTFPEGKQLYCALPFLSKFLGDGVLFLWDSKNMNETELCNVVNTMHNICTHYETEFFPEICNIVSSPPKILRCGIARGKVFSVGNGQDYVGPCINVSARLQKLSLLTFCFSRKGFNYEKGMGIGGRNLYLVKSVVIRGIGERELICVIKQEFENLPDAEKELFE